MDEERTVIHGCTANMLGEIDEKYLPATPPPAEGTYAVFIRPESRSWVDENYPEVCYELLRYDGRVLTFRITHLGVPIGYRVISEEHRGAGRVMDLRAVMYPEIGELLDAQQEILHHAKGTD